MEYMDVRQASADWRITERKIAALCRNGKVNGAYKEGKRWYIPKDAPKPVSDKTESMLRLPLPVGVSDFKEAVSKYYYVDKTLMIRDFLDTIPKVSLFTRPRRFGKTLNMDMLRVYFENTGENTSFYFRDKKIWACGKRYREHQGQYPVIFLSFKDIKFETWDETLDNIAYILSNEYDRHANLLGSPNCSEFEKAYFRKIVTQTASEQELTGALRELSKMLDEHYRKAPVIIVDEYDTPIQQGYTCNFYNKVILFMRNLFSGGFKDNRHLSYGFLTGILRVAKESIFSGLNNLKENSILDVRYSEYFGFTTDEIHSMMEYYDCEDKFDEICEWYNGYCFGNTDIFNPWSVINYLDDACTPKAFWQATGNNDIIREIVSEATPEIQENLQLLMQGKSISTYIDTSVIYPEIKKSPYSIYSFLLMAGYLKVVGNISYNDGNSILETAIPNKEIFAVYEKEILSAMVDVIPQSTAIAIQQAVIGQNISLLQKHLQDFLKHTISSFDTGSESFYHGLMLGLYAIMNNLYRITSNRESGDGRYDIQMEPYNCEYPGILIELKVLRNNDSLLDELPLKLHALSQEALGQINNKNYEDELASRGVGKIMKIGIAFYKKYAEISYEID